MDCREFDGQVVRLEKIKDVADKFIRVRISRIDDADLNLFEFDYDLTFMVFFLDAKENVYARYGGRDGKNADDRQSLEGLVYTMKSVLAMHEQKEKSYAPKSQTKPKYLHNLANPPAFGRGCMHCHQIKTALQNDLRKSGEWERDLVWRYPLPENIGLKLEVNRGNVVERVFEKSSASEIGIQPGDTLRRLNGVPIHSFGDAQFALDIAPKSGAVEIDWDHGDEHLQSKLALPESWRRTDLSWRTSAQNLISSGGMYGMDLTAEEKKSLGLAPKQLAFKQKAVLSKQAREAGIQGGDIILGVDGKTLEMDMFAFLKYMRSNYLVGDQVTINLIRDGRRMDLSMTLQR
jgi:predicted metalloprotease with PDZ domain